MLMCSIGKPHRSTFIQQMASLELLLLAVSRCFSLFLVNLAFLVLLFFICITQPTITRVICPAMSTAKPSAKAFTYSIISFEPISTNKNSTVFAVLAHKVCSLILAFR
jgi:hypothetical protein